MYFAALAAVLAALASPKALPVLRTALGLI